MRELGACGTGPSDGADDALRPEVERRERSTDLRPLPSY